MRFVGEKMFYFKNTFLFLKIDLNKICITQIRQNSCASVNQCWVGIERKAKYHSCIRLWTHAYIRFKVGMPFILDSMMCEIVNDSKDSKPTKIELKKNYNVALWKCQDIWVMWFPWVEMCCKVLMGMSNMSSALFVVIFKGRTWF